MKPAIRVESLAKSYRISHAAERGGYKTLRESMSGLVSAAFRRGHRGAAATSEEFWALKDVSFDVQPGEVVGIIGRNGAGKSTLLKILSRITRPTKGQVTLNGRVGSLLEVGTGFHPELTGRENVFLNGSILGLRRDEILRQFDAIVDFSGVERFLDTPVKRYSSGMTVRLAFAVAAHLNPEILVIDEVLAVGDSQFQKKCLGKMSDVAHSGRTILFVSHNMPAVETLCTRGVYLEEGKVDLIGTQTEAVRRYQDRLEHTISAGKYVASDQRRRSGSGVRILEAEVRSNGRYSPDGYPSGAALAFHIVCTSERAVHLPVMGIGIDAGHTNRVVTLDPRYDPSFAPWSISPGEVVLVECHVPSLVLAPGEYHVKLHFESENGESESLDPAFSFTVQASDFYGNGGKYGRGPILVRQAWRKCGV